jgi:hypothetical protein
MNHISEEAVHPTERYSRPRHCQLVVATHSPILLALPGAVIYQIGEAGEIQRIGYDQALPVAAHSRVSGRSREVLALPAHRRRARRGWRLTQRDNHAFIIVAQGKRHIRQ